MAETPQPVVLGEQEAELPAVPGKEPKRAMIRFVRASETPDLRVFLPKGMPT